MPFGPWNTQQKFEPNLNPPHFFAEVNNDIGKVLWKKNKRKEIEISFLLKKKSNKFFCRQRDQTNLTVRLISKDSFNASSVVWLIEITQERGKMDWSTFYQKNTLISTLFCLRKLRCCLTCLCWNRKVYKTKSGLK